MNHPHLCQKLTQELQEQVSPQGCYMIGGSVLCAGHNFIQIHRTQLCPGGLTSTGGDSINSEPVES